MMESHPNIRVQIVYALPKRQLLLNLVVQQGCTAIQAVQQSGILSQFPDIKPAEIKLGIFGSAVGGDQLLEDGDRVEINRPLIIDPKESRKQRAALVKAGKK